MEKPDAENLMNRYGQNHIPFLFMISFDMKEFHVLDRKNINPQHILFHINGNQNHDDFPFGENPVLLEIFPVSLEEYAAAFVAVQKEIRHGNSYLLNLTFPTKITTETPLLDIYKQSRAKYRLWYEDRFVFFSPEIFIQIRGNNIFSFPMKGTIDASVYKAEEKILENSKELAEHHTIVDLIRNDLSMVAKNVRVQRFRYIDHIISREKELLQVSSEIRGELQQGWESHLGSIIFRLLPAGSVSGAPKKKTVEIINRIETYNRGFYTGIFGYYDGNQLDSGVMIRFIEKTDDGLYYKSGGGITINSELVPEYNEMIDKVYVPLA